MSNKIKQDCNDYNQIKEKLKKGIQKYCNELIKMELA